jgi:hypothetical protein
MKKLTKFEELQAVDATLSLLEFWAWRADEAENTQLAESYARGHAAFEEQKQKILWGLSPEELKEYQAWARAARKDKAAKASQKKKSSKK